MIMNPNITLWEAEKSQFIYTGTALLVGFGGAKMAGRLPGINQFRVSQVHSMSYGNANFISEVKDNHGLITPHLVNAWT